LAPAAVLDAADAACRELSAEEWRAAIAQHPRIGESHADGASARERAWSAGEQSLARTAGESTRAALARGNTEYEARFGQRFIICATARSAEEMLAALRARLSHDRAAELAVTAEELRKITRLRLEKLLAER